MKAKPALMRTHVAMKEIFKTTHLLLMSSLLMFALIVSGGVVRTFGSSVECPNEMVCSRNLNAAGFELTSSESIHSFTGMLITLLVIATASLVLWRSGKNQRLRKSMAILLILTENGGNQ